MRAVPTTRDWSEVIETGLARIVDRYLRFLFEGLVVEYEHFHIDAPPDSDLNPVMWPWRIAELACAEVTVVPAFALAGDRAALALYKADPRGQGVAPLAAIQYGLMDDMPCVTTTIEPADPDITTAREWVWAVIERGRMDIPDVRLRIKRVGRALSLYFILDQDLRDIDVGPHTDEGWTRCELIPDFFAVHEATVWVVCLASRAGPLVTIGHHRFNVDAYINSSLIVEFTDLRIYGHPNV